MSYMSEYEKLKKKRQNGSEESGSYMSEYRRLQKKREESEEEDIAPYFSRLGDNKTDLSSFSSFRSAVAGLTKEEDERTWFQSGAFSDGYQFGDVTKTILGTASDLTQDLTAGALCIVEGTIDAGAYLVGGAASLFGADKFAEDTRNFIKKDIINEEKIGAINTALSPVGVVRAILNGGFDWDGSTLESESVLGDKTDSLVQSGGQLAEQIGLQAVGVPWYVTSGVTSFGSEAENAFNQGASYGEAGLSGVINAGAEILSEKLFGGSGLGEKGLINVDLLTKGIANKATKALADWGVDVVGEGAEEVVSQFFSNLGTSLYREENLMTVLFSEEAIDGYIESAIGGSVLGGVMNASHAYKSTKSKTDYRTGLTANDQKVFDKVFNDRLEKATKEGKKPNEAKIRDELLEDINKGYITTEEIESVLGGESYKAYKDTVEIENALLAQQKALQDEYNALNKMAWRDMTGEQFDRRDELKAQLADINAKVADMQKNSQQSKLKSKLGKEVFAMVKDSRLVESYNEHIRSTQDLNIDVTKYDGVARKTIENAIKSGANNSNRVRDFVELSAKAAKAVNTAVDFGDNKKVNAVLENQLVEQINELSQTPVESRTSAQVKELAELQEMLQKVKGGKITVNGVKTKDGILINTQSAKALDFILGHEVTHKLEKTEAYKELQKSLFDYAESLNDLQGRRSIAERLYKNIKGTTVDKELTSDLSGEYLFSDYDFVKNFAVEHRNAFQKVLDQIKYWAKVATAGSKEARQLEKAKKLYEDALQELARANAEQTKVKKEGFVPASEAVQFNFAAVPVHKEKLQSQFTVDSTVDLPELLNRYDKVIEIWEKLGGELDSKFLNEWNAKKGKDRSFSVFKAQAGYKYNVELSSMCKKGVPLFEAIDTIVKNEVMKELNTDVLGKAEKEILYDLLKTNDFEIPCAICYVEQARQREGVIINDFLNGKAESAKLGWNATLTRVQEEMAKSGVNYTFRNVDRSIATDSYVPVDDAMDEATQDAFYSALKKLANEEIARYNKENGKNRPLLKDVTPEAVKDAFGGMLPSNLKIFKVLFTEPSSRFMIDRDLLYSSMTTRNLSSSHNALYSLFNSQGGVSGYKTKQGTVVYWGDILGKKWIPSTLRNEGGVRNQSNSDFQMYTLIDQAQMYMDFTAKGYYLQAYTKVLSELKLFGLSRGKINASLIPAVKVFKNADGTVDIEKTMENAGLDENGDLLFDDIEGINHSEAFMLIADPEYSKNIGGICIGYSDNHISKMLDDPRIQLIIGFHDKTNDPAKRYRGARYAKNYNGENEAVNNKDGKTVHIGFNKYVQKAEKMFSYDAKTESFSGTAKFKGKEYTANDIPKLAADMYLDMCAKKNYTPAYDTFKGHENYYKLLADFSLYDSQGNYAPHRKVAYDMPSQVPYLDVNGAKQYMDSDKYIKGELEKELKVRDAISEKLADRSENGIIPQFIKRVNELHQEDQFSLAEEVGEIDSDTQFSISVTDTETLDFLNEQVSRGEYDAETNPDGGYYVTYKSMSFWGYDDEGNAILRSPMAEYVDGELSNAYLLTKDKSKLNWYKATETLDEQTGLPTGLLVGVKEEGKKSKKYVPASENQDLIAEDWSNLYFMLNKKVFNKKTGKWKNSPVPARYNPYEHSSNSMLNDQFKAAWQRDNLVTVKMYVPRSEDNGAYRAQWSKDPTGWADWKSGDVAGKINKQKDLQRRVYLSRYAAPVEIVPDSEVAQAYKGYIEGTDVEIPDNVVSPNLLNELKKAGVPIQESGQVQYSISEADNTYLDAVNRGDTKTAQKMVDEAAKNAGYTPEHLYHGTSGFGFTKIDVNQSDDGISFFVADKTEVAQGYFPYFEDESDEYHDSVRAIGKASDKPRSPLYTSMGVDEVVAKIKEAMPEQYASAKPATKEEVISYLNRTWIPKTVSAAIDLKNYSITPNVESLVDSVIEANSEGTYEAWKAVADRYKEFADIYDIYYNGQHFPQASMLWLSVQSGIQMANKAFKPDAVYNNGEIIGKNVLVERYNDFLSGEANGIYDLYANHDNQLVIRGRGSNWNDLPLGEATADFNDWWVNEEGHEPSVSGQWYRADTRSIAKYAKARGYRSVRFEDIYDAGAYGDRSEMSTVYAFFHPDEDIKSADTVTYDDSNNIIPLSQRFNKGNNDIRYSLSGEGEDTAPVGNHLYGKDFGVKSPDDIAPYLVENEAIAPVGDEHPSVANNRADVESVIGDKDSFVSKQAMELYNEIANLKKGVRASKRLGYLLDHGYEWRSIKTALLNIKDNPNQVVNPNSAAESVAREMLGREYDAMVDEFANAQGVTGKIFAKMQNLGKELENNKRLREQSSEDFDSEIARLQAEYEAKKNKNTKVANDLLRRIERTQRMKANVDADYGKRISDLENRIEKMSKPGYKTAMQRRAKQNEYSNLMAKLVGDTSTWVDKKLGISYKVNTLRRNLRDVVRDSNGNRDIAKADAIYDELQGKYNHNEAELKRESMRIKEVFQKLNLNHTEDTYAHMLGEFRHNPDTKLTEETVKEFYEKHKSKIDTKKVDTAIEESRKVFDDLIVRVNERLREQGMKEIPYRQGYFPHFTNPKQGWLAKLLNWKTVDTEIPTSIAGLTETFNPERSWQGFSKQRKGDTTDYSLEQGLDTYIHGALDWIYHIEDIQKRRALENHIRYVHSEEGVKARIDAINSSEELDADEAQRQIDAVYAEANNPLNNFVTNLRAGTNTLANKKSENDRQIESDTNRKIYSVMTNLNNRINANMVVGSFSSALTNFIPITQSWMEVSPVYSLKGMRDTILSTIRDDGMVNKSDFLTNRFMNEENLYQTAWDKVSDKAGILMEAIDSFTSQTVWRSKYLQNISEGMSETEAIKNADQFAENVIAGRSRGNQPTIFDAKNPITKIFTAFQLEVANQYGYMFKDAPQDSVNKARLVKGYATAFLGAYAYNALYSSLVGRDAAFDPISILEDLFKDLFGGDDEEEELGDAFLNLVDNVLEEVPFVGGLLGGGRIPISSIMPYSGEYEGLSGFVSDVSEGDWEKVTKEMLSPLYYLAMPVGGGQIKKTVEGLGMFSDDHPVAGSYTDSGSLRFPVEDTFWNRTQAALFGQYANKNARDYFDNERSPLKEKQIQEYIDVDLPIRDYWEYREGLSEQETLEDKFNYIAGLDLPVAKKNILINNIVDRKEPVDMEGYEDFSGYEEFDFATKNPEKYEFFEANGVSFEEYQNADEDGKRFYSDAFEVAKKSPAKVTMAKAVSDSFVEFYRLTRTANSIKGVDLNGDGKTDSGSKKANVYDYIFSLDLDYGQKVILYRSMYDSKSDKATYNMDIVNYLNSRDDISYEEMVAILEELDFTVNGNNVSW